MLEQLTKLLGNNSFASGGLFLLGAGAGMTMLYRLQSYVFRFISHWFFTQIDFTSDDPNFIHIQNWLFNQSYTKGYCSKFRAKNIYKNSQDSVIERNEVVEQEQIFVPSYGTHYFFINYRPIILSYTRSDAKEIRTQEYITLSVFNIFGKFKFAESLVKEATDIYTKKTYNETTIFGSTDRWSSWHKLQRKNIRQKPILSYPTEYSEIVDNIQTFLDNKEWYNFRGINYKHGILFAGVPGAGKTSCVLSLAQRFQRHIYMLNLADPNIDDARFIDLVTSLPKDSILLLEDIDAVPSAEDRKKQKDNKEDGKIEEDTIVSLSTILNTLDGLLTPDGLIFFITTNYPDKLDEALVRPGRIDLIKNFENANEYQIGALFERFIPESNKNEKELFIQQFKGKSMAAIEAELISKVL